MDEKEAETRPLMGTIFLEYKTYYTGQREIFPSSDE